MVFISGIFKKSQLDIIIVIIIVIIIIIIAVITIMWMRAKFQL